jgi:hypothetical protein
VIVSVLRRNPTSPECNTRCTGALVSRFLIILFVIGFSVKLGVNEEPNAYIAQQLCSPKLNKFLSTGSHSFPTPDIYSANGPFIKKPMPFAAKFHVQNV